MTNEQLPASLSRYLDALDLHTDTSEWIRPIVKDAYLAGLEDGKGERQQDGQRRITAFMSWIEA